MIGIENSENVSFDEWLNAKFEGGRHAARVDMIMDVEKKKIINFVKTKKNVKKAVHGVMICVLPLSFISDEMLRSL